LISLYDSISLRFRKVLPCFYGFLRRCIYEYPYASSTSDGNNYVISALKIVNDANGMKVGVEKIFKLSMRKMHTYILLDRGFSVVLSL